MDGKGEQPLGKSSTGIGLEIDDLVDEAAFGKSNNIFDGAASFSFFAEGEEDADGDFLFEVLFLVWAESLVAKSPSEPVLQACGEVGFDMGEGACVASEVAVCRVLEGECGAVLHRRQFSRR